MLIYYILSGRFIVPLPSIFLELLYIIIYKQSSLKTQMPEVSPKSGMQRGPMWRNSKALKYKGNQFSIVSEMLLLLRDPLFNSFLKPSTYSLNPSFFTSFLVIR